MSEAAQAPKPKPDWERIEQHYRAGVMSLREIAGEHGISDTAIRKRAKRDAWERDLSAKIQAKADALVRSAEVRAEVRSANQATEKETIDANAKAIADIRLGHRSDIRTSRALALKMLAELSGIHERPDLIEALQEALAGDPDDTDPDTRKQKLQQMRDALYRITSLPGQVGALKALSDTLKTLIGLEREAWGMDEPEKGDGGPDAPMPDTELASKLAYFVDLGKRRLAQQAGPAE